MDHLDQYNEKNVQAAMNMVMKRRISYNAGNFSAICGTIRFAKRTPLG
jgi:hypothetical protein